MQKSLKINAILNGLKQSFSILFPLLTFPYASRVLGCEEYGKYAFSSSIVNYFALFAAFGISNFAVREGARLRKNREDLSLFCSELFSFNLVTSTVSYILLFVLVFSISKINVYHSLILIQSLCIIFTALGMDYVNIIYEDFLYITIRYIAINFLALIAIFTFVRDSKDTFIYCLILVCASYCGNLLNLIYIRKYVDIRLNFRIHLRKMFLPLLLLTINSFAVTFYVNSDITILGFFYPDDIVGVYSFSSKIYNIVKQLINAIIVVTIPRLSFLKDNDDVRYKEYVQKIFELLFLIVAPVAVGLFVLSKALIFLAGGNSYLSGTVSLKILSFSLLFALPASVFTNGILVVNRLEKFCLISTVISALLNIGLNFFLIPVMGMTGSAITTVIAEAVNLFLQMYFSAKKLKIAPQISIKNFFTVLLGSLVIISFSLFFNFIFPEINIKNEILVTVSTFLCSIMCYFIFLRISKNSVLSLIKFK